MPDTAHGGAEVKKVLRGDQVGGEDGKEWRGLRG
jgi:hypothetical protein